MNDDDLFSGGFGNQQQPFSLDIGEMDPFSDGTSPWGEVGGSLHVETVRRDETDDEGEETLPNKFEQLDVASNESSRETSNTASQELEKTGIAAHKELAEETDTSPIASPGTAPPTSPTSKDQLATRASPLGGYGVQVQAARRVGVIRRGLRSPRMLDSQQSSSSDPFVDPLSSAAAAAESGEPGGISAASAGAAATAGRASLDVPPSQAAARRGNMEATRQTRSQSRASLADNTSGSVESGGVAAASSPPHPYEQQLAQAQQREQTANARQQIEGGKSRTSTPSSERLSSGSAGGNRTSTSRVYLGAHQRRKSLDPTPADQMPRFSIHVMDPVKVSDSLKSYIAYKVKTQSSAAMFRESEMIVRRRYRDFDWLTQELAARHPGIIVPAIPEKQSMGRFEDEFV
ncbi:Vacuolar protein sorting-associated protein vps5, partial [Linderina pennispora]